MLLWLRPRKENIKPKIEGRTKKIGKTNGNDIENEYAGEKNQ